MLDFCHDTIYNKVTVKEDLTSKAGKSRKGGDMDEEMNVSELLREVVEENQTRKILEILNESKDLEEAKGKVKALLDK